jgi:NAD(P)-dependent dehydrogenase (short-subunit alcohol dehydrogenase family)
MKQVVFLTGATGKVGTQLARYFTKQGAKVIAVSRSVDKLNQLADSCTGGHLVPLQLDLLQPLAVTDAVTFLKTKELSPHVLINAARDIDHLGTPSKLTETRQKWLDGFTLDVVVPFELTMALANQTGSKLESVINLSSMYGVVAQNPALYEDPTVSLTPNYGASKAAAIQLTRDLAVQLANRKIRVNSVSFGGIKGRVDQAFLNRYAKLVPLGRMMEESEVVAPIAYLVSDKSSYLTGQNMIVDGGWTAW